MGTKTLAARPGSRLMLQVHKGVRATKDPLRESLVDGGEKAQPIVKVEQTTENLERRRRNFRWRIVYRMRWVAELFSGISARKGLWRTIDRH